MTGLRLDGTMGLASAIAVTVMLLATATLLPALLGSAGTKIERSRPPRSRCARLQTGRNKALGLGTSFGAGFNEP